MATMKADGEPIAMLTAYDSSFARLIDRAGVDCVLVGDSLGNVIQGR
ncbi:MAG: 3-methyl-2-oxobutanoate hydroxymethyltransferase, partial [Wenzhouxiangella sp.]